MSSNLILRRHLRSNKAWWFRVLKAEDLLLITNMIICAMADEEIIKITEKHTEEKKEGF